MAQGNTLLSELKGALTALEDLPASVQRRAQGRQGKKGVDLGHSGLEDYAGPRAKV